MGGYYNESPRSGMGDNDLTPVAQDRNIRRAVLNAVMNLRVSQNAGKFLIT